jgi:hypothetical protein
MKRLALIVFGTLLLAAAQATAQSLYPVAVNNVGGAFTTVLVVTKLGAAGALTICGHTQGVATATCPTPEVWEAWETRVVGMDELGIPDGGFGAITLNPPPAAGSALLLFGPDGEITALRAAGP